MDSNSGPNIHSYEGGRLISSPRFPGLRPDCLSRASISLAPDSLAMIDHADRKSIRIFDTSTGKQLSANITHSSEITEVALSLHATSLQDRRLAFLDKDHDLYLTRLLPPSNYTAATSGALSQHKVKLQTQVDSIHWNDRSDLFAAISDGALLVWLYPNVVYVDRDLLGGTKMKQEAGPLGKMPVIVAFEESRVLIRRADGAMMTVSIPLYPIVLHQMVDSQRWDEAVKICRVVKSDQLWACLAAMAIQAKQLETAETAFAALCHIDKLEYLLHIMSIPAEEVERRSAELAVYRRCPEEAERILLQASPPYLYHAIKLNIRLFRWRRALELALTHRVHLDTVIAYRQRYLAGMGRREGDPNFLQYAEQVEVDWSAIKARRREEDEGRKENRHRGERSTYK